MKQFNSQRGVKYGGAKKATTKKALYGGMDIRVFVNKDSPDYEKPCADTYSARQLDMISGALDPAKVRLNELRGLIYKADKLGDIELAGRMEEIYNRRRNPDMYAPDISYGEAIQLLADLEDEE